MKKNILFGVFAVALLSLGVASCGPTSDPTSTPDAPTSTPDAPTTAPEAPTSAPTSSAKTIQSITIAD